MKNLDEIMMNMNLIEQIYGRKKSNNPAASEYNLNEILNKNKKNDLHNNNRNNVMISSMKRINI